MKLILILLFFFLALNFARWNNHGKDIFNTRYDSENEFINSRNVDRIINTWNFTASSYISGTPSIREGVVYFCDFGGYLFAINSLSGNLIWKYKISDATNIPNDHCRATPTVTNKNLFIGTQKGAYLLKLDLHGNLLSKLLLDQHQYAIVTMSGTFFENKIYVGVASSEEGVFPPYPCCSFRGSFHCIDTESFTIIWSQYAFPETYPTGPGGLSGIGYWGSSPVIDEKRNSVYVATGNPYDIPQEWQDCYRDNVSASCIPSDVLFNSIISYDLDNGSLKWVTRRSEYDAWIVQCIFNGPDCPSVPGPDADFGMSPSMITNKNGEDVLVIGQKSGVVWSINPNNGNVLGSVLAGPDATLGGINWGGATDGSSYFVGIINQLQKTWNFVNLVPPTHTSTKKGFFSKVDIATMKISCQVGINLDTPLYETSTFATGPPSLVNDVWIATSTNAVGKNLFFIDKNTCKILKSFSLGTTIYGGASVNDRCVYVGSGYKPAFNQEWTEGEFKLFAFCLPQNLPQPSTATTINIYNNQVCK